MNFEKLATKEIMPQEKKKNNIIIIKRKCEIVYLIKESKRVRVQA